MQYNKDLRALVQTRRHLDDFILASDVLARAATLNKSQIAVVGAMNNLLSDLCVHLAREFKAGTDVTDRVRRVTKLIRTFHRLVYRAVYRPSITGLDLEASSRRAMARARDLFKKMGSRLAPSIAVLSTMGAVYYIVGHTAYIISKAKLGQFNANGQVWIAFQQHFMRLLLDSTHGPLMFLTFVGLYTSSKAGKAFSEFIAEQALRMGIALGKSETGILVFFANAVMHTLVYFTNKPRMKPNVQQVRLSTKERGIYEILYALTHLGEYITEGFQYGNMGTGFPDWPKADLVDVAAYILGSARESGAVARAVYEKVLSFIQEHG